MKKFCTDVKSLILVTLLCVLLSSTSFSQDISDGELMVVNKSGTSSGKLIKINIYPVGAVFSGGQQYTLDATYAIANSSGKIYGYTDILKFDQNLPEQEWTAKINFDATELREDCETSLGYGKYRIDFFAGADPDSMVFRDYCIIDYSDANYGTANFQGEQKIRIDYTSTNITFNFLSSQIPHDLNEVGKNIRVWEQYGSGSPSSIPSKGMFNDTTLSQYHNFPIDARDFGAVDHISPGDFSLNMNVKYAGANIKQNQILNFKKSGLTVNGGLVLTVNPTSEINFTGKGANLSAYSNSEIHVPENFVIRLTDTATIQLDGAKFTTNSEQTSWRGIRLINIGAASSILNSEFEYADTAVGLSEHLHRPFTFKSNTFKIVDDNSFRIALWIKNSYNLLIQGNYFYLPTMSVSNNMEAAIHIINYLNFPPLTRLYTINVVNNFFYDGYYQLNVLGYASNFIPVYISENYFENAFYNFLGRKCIGDIKNNEFANTFSRPGGFIVSGSINTNMSNLNFLENEFHSVQYNLLSGFSSYPNLAPIRDSDNQLIWTGGRNELENENQDNIYINGGSGYLFINEGENVFTVSNSSDRHIYGFVDDTTETFFANKNCWYGNLNQSNIELYNNSNDPIPFEAVSNLTCRAELLPENSLTFPIGFGLVNTTYMTNSQSTGEVPDDESLYAKAIKNISASNLNLAAGSFRSLIDNYPDSKFLEVSLQKLYEVYSRMDTINTQSNTNQIFGGLKNFLEDKIEMYSSNDEFVKLAYELVLMCDTRMKNFNDALSGYEYIAENTSDPTVSGFAALDYIGVLLLSDGSGGSVKIKKKKKFEDVKPINRILKNIFDKETYNKKHQRNINDQVRNKTKVKQLLNTARNMNNQSKTKTISELGLQYMNFGSQENLKETKEQSNSEVKLSQNSPNPFNPITHFQYELPFENFVTVKIYDAVGKEISMLVNEFKLAGKYDVTFNGTNLPSGIYFYKIKTGNFEQVRKMILVK